MGDGLEAKAISLIQALDKRYNKVERPSVVPPPTSADASVVRIVVDDPERCHDALAKAGIPSNESNIVVVEMPRGPEKLDTVLRSLVAAEVNIQYTYSLMVRPHDKALLALNCEDPEFARDVLSKADFSVLGQKDISR